jgi:hypothetical protein
LEPATANQKLVRKTADFSPRRPGESALYDPLRIEQNRIVPSITRIFSPTNTLYIFHQSYLKKAANLGVSLVFLKDGKEFRKAGNLEMTQFDEGSKDTITSYFQLPLSDFPKGPYLLEVKLDDQLSQEHLQQQVNFVVQ